MNSNYIVFMLLLFVVIIPWIRRKKTAAAVKHILNNKKNNKEKSAMKELASQFIGKECLIYTLNSSDSLVKGIIKQVSDGGIIVEKKDGIEAINLDYITRIREWPRNSKGKKKQVLY